MAPPAQTRGLAQPPPPPPRPKPSLCKYICFVVLFLIVLLGLATLITWLVVRPKKLRYSIEDASISGYNLTKSNHLDSHFHFLLRAHNPNKRVSIYYDKIDVTVWHANQELANTNVHPFYQRRKEVKNLDLDLDVKDCGLGGPEAQKMRKERDSGYVNLDLKFDAKIRFKVGVFKIHRELEVSCDALQVPVDKSKGSFKTVFCDVDIDD